MEPAAQMISIVFTFRLSIPLKCHTRQIKAPSGLCCSQIQVSARLLEMCLNWVVALCFCLAPVSFGCAVRGDVTAAKQGLSPKLQVQKTTSKTGKELEFPYFEGLHSQRNHMSFVF